MTLTTSLDLVKFFCKSPYPECRPAQEYQEWRTELPLILWDSLETKEPTQLVYQLYLCNSQILPTRKSMETASPKNSLQPKYPDIQPKRKNLLAYFNSKSVIFRESIRNWSDALPFSQIAVVSIFDSHPSLATLYLAFRTFFFSKDSRFLPNPPQPFSH